MGVPCPSINKYSTNNRIYHWIVWGWGNIRETGNEWDIDLSVCLSNTFLFDHTPNIHPTPQISFCGIHTTKHQSLVDGLFLEEIRESLRHTLQISFCGIHTTTYSQISFCGIHTTKHKSIVDGFFFREFRESLQQNP